MALTTLNGPRTWELSRDQDGHRDYRVVHLVKDDLQGSIPGPNTILNNPGIPLIGDPWVFGTDLDIWATCRPEARVAAHEQNEQGRIVVYRIEQVFSTRPFPRCQDVNIDDPLLEPPKVSGSFVKYTQEVTRNKDGNPIKTSSHELVRGPQVEFDFNRPTVRIEQNVADLELDVFSQMVDTVNDTTLWGLPARTIKLSNAPWERRYRGICEIYYTRIFEFDIDYNTFDRVVVDEGTKCLRGKWKNYGTAANPNWLWDAEPGANPNNIKDFIQYKDKNGENSRVLLDGQGLPFDGTVAGTGTGTGGSVGTINIQFYPESNFLLLGIPTLL